MKTLLLLLSLAIPALADRSLTLAWDANPPAELVTGYEVYVDGKLANQVDGNQTTSQVTIPDAKCVVAIVAVSLAGRSDPASLPIPASPSNPKGLRVTAILRTTVSTP